MRVALLRVLPEENWRSIDIYSDRLHQALPAAAPDIDFVQVKVPAWDWSDLKVPTPYGRQASLRTLGFYLSRWVRYPLALRRIKADIYHILDNSYGHLAFFLDPARTIVTSHGGTSQSWRHWQPDGPAMWLFDQAFRGTLRAKRIIFVSEYSRQELLTETGYPAGQTDVVHHGIDPVFRPASLSQIEKQRAELLQSKDEYLLLHVGHNAARKNVAVLYHVIAQLRQQGYTARLIQIGAKPTAAQLKLAAELDIAAFITHIPHVKNEQLPIYYSAADVFIFPSLYEGFGIPLIEAMACGTPVVCSDSPLFREVGEQALRYADPQQPEAIAREVRSILGQPELAAELRELGLIRAKNFTWQKMAEKTVAVYRTFTKKG